MDTASKRKARAALSNWNWGAIAAGVVVALASQILLLWLGDAVVTSVGDKHPEGGFAFWVVLVQLGSLFVGAAFAAFLARPTLVLGGAAIGAFTWALALILGSAIAARPLAGWRPDSAAAAAWTTFFGALLSLGTAMLGGVLGGRRSHRDAGDFEGDRALITDERVITVTPMG
ncbi:MAG: hypothetical protein SFX73_28605 [Kofleriaceae bacterium]|nr:hypothetical protein [Kofleriaceae bacterium]